MGGLDCQGSFIPTVVAPCLSLGGERTETDGFKRVHGGGEGAARTQGGV